MESRIQDTIALEQLRLLPLMCNILPLWSSEMRMEKCRPHKLLSYLFMAESPLSTRLLECKLACTLSAVLLTWIIVFGRFYMFSIVMTFVRHPRHYNFFKLLMNPAVPVQNYITAIIIFLVVEMLMTWGFYGMLAGYPCCMLQDADELQTISIGTAPTWVPRF